MTATAAPNKFNVWYPVQYLPSMNVPNAAQLTAGAFLSFDTQAEADAAVQRRSFGVMLNPSGDFAFTQPWFQAGYYFGAIPSAAAALQPTLTPGKHNVWIPASLLSSVSITDTKKFAQGAYVAVDSAADAKAMVTALQIGVIFDPQGAPAASQSWSSANSFVAQLHNPKLTAVRADGKVSVWFPPAMLGQLGVNDTKPFNVRGAFLSFANEAEAQAHVKLRSFGVILDAKGAAASTQPWPQGAGFAVQLLNDKLTATRTPGAYSVWFPQQYLWNLGITDPAPFPNGAYMSFATAAEAQAHVTARSSGVILDAAGKADATQLWANASQFAAQLLNVDLAAAPKAGKFNVWFPAAMLGSLGMTPPKEFQTTGAYLAFDTEAEAQAHVNARTLGVVTDGKGEPLATQPWSWAGIYSSQRLNGQLKDKPVDGQFNVWFPANYVGSLGVANPAAFPNGAWIAFKTEAEAQAHSAARTFGVVMDGKGDATAKQTWGQAGQFLAQLLNPKMTGARQDGQPSVWFPPVYLSLGGRGRRDSFSRGQLHLVPHGRSRGGTRDRPRPRRAPGRQGRARSDAAVELRRDVRCAAAELEADRDCDRRQAQCLVPRVDSCAGRRRPEEVPRWRVHRLRDRSRSASACDGAAGRGHLRCAGAGRRDADVGAGAAVSGAAQKRRAHDGAHGRQVQRVVPPVDVLDHWRERRDEVSRGGVPLVCEQARGARAREGARRRRCDGEREGRDRQHAALVVGAG